MTKLSTLGTSRTVSLNVLSPKMIFVELAVFLTSKLAAANANQKHAEQAKNFSICMKTLLIPQRLPAATVSVPTENALAISILTLLTAIANAHLTTVQKVITSILIIASVSAKRPPHAVQVYFGALLLVVVSATQQLQKMLALPWMVKTFISIPKVVLAFASHQ